MAITAKSAPPGTSRRVWHTPTSKVALFWGLFAVFYCAIFYLMYAVFFNADIFRGPWFDRVFRVGVMSYVMILVVSAYSLRTRFMHSLPWKAQNWLWLHMWFGIASVLLALLHADYSFVLHWDCSSSQNCITAHYWGMPALYALFFIAISGVIGRLIDMWQTHIIAQDASTNGVGISKAIKVRLLELEYIIERFSAGKSEPFKQYCSSAIASLGKLPTPLPNLSAQEQSDFQNAHQSLEEYVRLTASLRKQKAAQTLLRSWRYVHMVLVPVALFIISYHCIAELLINVLHVIKV